MLQVTRSVVLNDAQAIEKKHAYSLTFSNENGTLVTVNCEIYRRDFHKGISEETQGNVPTVHVGRISLNNGRISSDLSSDESLIEHLKNFDSYVNEYKQMSEQSKTK